MLLVPWDGASGTLCGFAVLLGVPWQILGVSILHMYMHTESPNICLCTLYKLQNQLQEGEATPGNGSQMAAESKNLCKLDC